MIYRFIGLTVALVFFLHGQIIDVPALWNRVLAVDIAPRTLFTLGSFLVHEAVFIVLSLVMALIDYTALPIFTQYKIQSAKYPKGELLKRAVIQVAINHFLVQLPGLYLNYETFVMMGMSSAVEDLPAWQTIMWQLTACMVIEDTLFYWGHRLLHHPKIYGKIHKRHHQFYTPVGLAAEYAHPIEYFVANSLPFSAGPMLIGLVAGPFHLYTFWLWFVLRIGETIDGHCGYAFPWTPYRLLPFSGSVGHHDFHHSKNIGNFSSFFTFWDTLCGTDKAYREWKSREDMRAIKNKSA